jgi:hypothetical protein
VLWAESAVALVAFVSAVVALAAGSLVAAWTVPCAVFGVTGAVAPTAVVKTEGSGTVAVLPA